MPSLPVDDGEGTTRSRPLLRARGDAPLLLAAAPPPGVRPALRLVRGTEAGPGLTTSSVLRDLNALTVEQPDVDDIDLPRERMTPERPAAAGAAGVESPEQRRTAALLRLAQRGDGEAFGRIYDRYVDQVYRYIFFRVGSHALAEDLTSETFLRALRRIGSFSWQGRDIGAWFMTIARNLVSDHVKSSRFRLEVPTADMLDADHPDDGIEQIVLDRLQAAALLDALRELKPDHQECLVLRFLHGLSVAETAEVMNRSEGAVKQLQLRGIRSLAKLLNRRGGAHP